MILVDVFFLWCCWLSWCSTLYLVVIFFFLLVWIGQKFDSCWVCLFHDRTQIIIDALVLQFFESCSLLQSLKYWNVEKLIWSLSVQIQGQNEWTIICSTSTLCCHLWYLWAEPNKTVTHCNPSWILHVVLVYYVFSVLIDCKSLWLYIDVLHNDQLESLMPVHPI